MGKNLAYVDEFSYPSSWGFSGSSKGPDLPNPQPLTPARQGLEYGTRGNEDGGPDAGYVARLARGGMPRPKASKAPVARPPATAKMPRRAPMPAAPGPSPAPGASPMGNVMGPPGLPPQGALSSMTPPPENQMAMGGRMGKAKGGHLTMADRKALPKSDFALPGKGAGPSGKGSGSYPIPDASHARNALSRVSQNGSPAQKAEVRAAVHRKFPAIGKGEPDGDEGFSRGGGMRTLGDRQGFFDGGHAKMHKAFGFSGSLKKAEGGAAVADQTPTPTRRPSIPVSGSYADENDRKGTPGRFYANEPERGRFGERNTAPKPTPKPMQRSRPLPMPPPVPPHEARRGTVSVDVRPRRPAPSDDAGSSPPPDTRFDFGAGMPSLARGGLMRRDDAPLGGYPQEKTTMPRQMQANTPAMAKGGHARLPTGMKPKALQRHSPINTPPRNPQRTTTPRNIAPGGQMAYGVQPSSEADPAGSKQGIPHLAKGGRVKAGCF